MASADARLLDYVESLRECVKETQKSSSEPLAPLLSSAEYIRQLADALLDGVMFEIIDSLRELQLMTEGNLYRKRNDLIQDQTARRKQFQSESEDVLAVSSSYSKQNSLQERARMLQNLEKQFVSELKNFDVSIVLDLDKRLAEQQGTLQRAGLPGFTVSTEPTDILFQMQVMNVITLLEKRIGRILVH